ncbi:MAG: diguanylate cyclase [Armatimonadetes bacterium]|nr:diguanylate cyclase [Armatimonadota bacterium]
MASVLVECARRIDCLGRYDERRFILLLPQTGEQAAVLCERVRSRLDERQFRCGTEPAARLTVRCGIAVHPASGTTPEQLVTASEVALRDAVAGDRPVVVHLPETA